MSVRPSRRAFLAGLTATGLTAASAHVGARTGHAQVANVGVDCLILTYHEVPNRARFSSQIRGYLQRGYQPIGLLELESILHGDEVPLWGKPLVITFDDGLRSQRDNALPVLAELQVPAVFAVMVDWRGDGVHRYMTNDDFKRLVGDHGLEVISHTFHHTNLVRERTRNHGSWQAQIVDSKGRLEEVIGDGYEVRGFCYPFGAYDAATLDLVGRHYSVALTTRAGTRQTTADRLQLRRTSMS